MTELAKYVPEIRRVLTRANAAADQYKQFQASVRNDTINRLRLQRKLGTFGNHQFRMLTSGMIQRWHGGKWHNWSNGATAKVTPWIGVSYGFYHRGNGTLLAHLRMAMRNRNYGENRVGFDLVVCPTQRPDPAARNDTKKSVAVNQAYVSGVFNKQGLRFIPGHDSFNLIRTFRTRYQRHPSPKHVRTSAQLVWVRFFTYRVSDKKVGANTFKSVLNHPSQHSFFKVEDTDFLING